MLVPVERVAVVESVSLQILTAMSSIPNNRPTIPGEFGRNTGLNRMIVGFLPLVGMDGESIGQDGIALITGGVMLDLRAADVERFDPDG